MKYKHISAINQMVFENRGECDYIEKNKEYNELLDKYVKIEEEFEETFLTSEAALYLYRKVIDALDFLNCEECHCYYREVFRFGVLIGLDIAGLIKNE